MFETGPPAGRVLDGHGGHDLIDGFVGHRPQDALADRRISNTDYIGGDAGAGRCKNLDRRLEVEPADQSGESGSVEMVDGGSRGGQLHGMAPLGSQVQICPGDHVLTSVGGQSPQAKSLQHRTETHLDADQFKAAGRAASKDDITDPRQSLPHDVHDLGVEDVAREADFVVAERTNGRGDREGRRVVIAVDENTGVLEALYCRPWHQQVWSATALHKDPLDQTRTGLVVEASCEVGDPAEHLTVGPRHILAGHFAEQEHSRNHARIPGIEWTLGVGRTYDFHPHAVTTSCDTRDFGPARKGIRPTRQHDQQSGLPPLLSPACRAHRVHMDSLSMLDAGFLEAEDSDRHVSLAIGSVAVLDGPIPAYDAFVSGLAERVLAVPRFRQVLRTHPLDLEAPQWVDAKNFDISHHVHRVALPQPGDDAALFRLTADLMEHRLDRERPLWDCWIVEGLPNNQWAMIMKLHHCIADGIATMHMLAGLSDSGEGDTYATAIRAAKEPVRRGLWLPELSADPRQWIGNIWHTSTVLAGGARRALAGTVGILGGLLRPAPTSLVGPVTAMRRYATAEVSLDDVALVCREFDVTLNDVALAAITDAFRAVLIGRGEKPKRDSLRTLVPVSVRSNDDIGKADNRVSLMLPYLPVEKSDAEDQLRTVHSRLTRAKASGQRQAGHIFISAANIIPFPLTAWAVRVATRLPQRGVVTVATNVPGPRQKMHIMGRKVVRMFPIPPIALGLRTAIAIVSYADKLVFGITGDYDTAPDIDDIARGIERAVANLAALRTPA